MAVTNGRFAEGGDIAVENKDATSHEIALSITAPGQRTLTENLMRKNRTRGTLARNVPAGISWELLIWKRTSSADPWTFSTAYTIGEFTTEPGRTILLIEPSIDQVSRAYTAPPGPGQPDPDPLPPMIPGWRNGGSGGGQPPMPPSPGDCSCVSPRIHGPVWYDGTYCGPACFGAGTTCLPGYSTMSPGWYSNVPVMDYKIKYRGRKFRR
ncbi:MAG: hypothetical protein RIK87_26350 [Fuerstiella sp.]